MFPTDFLTAGVELVPHTVSFFLHYLSENPEVQEKIFEETKAMSDTFLTHENVCEAHYTRAAIHEAFRLSPVAFAIARIIEEDVYVSGYHLKAGVSSLNWLELFQFFNFFFVDFRALFFAKTWLHAPKMKTSKTRQHTNLSGGSKTENSIKPDVLARQ